LNLELLFRAIIAVSDIRKKRRENRKRGENQEAKQKKEA